MELTRSIVRLGHARYRAAMPAHILDKARLHVADAIGIALAATRERPLVDQLAHALGAGGAAGDGWIIGSVDRLPPASAAFRNAALMHLLDFDDIHDGARLHPTTVTLAAALAAADLARVGDDGIARAVAVANELQCRLGTACKPTGAGPASGWFLTQLFGYFGAALAASLVLDLSEDDTASALGFAYMQAAGGKEAGFGVGSTARAIYPAFAAMGGVQAALLAHAGITAPQRPFEGDAGLYRLYLGGEPDEATRATLLDEHAWAFAGTEIKPWPSCRLSHPYVAAALEARAALDGVAIEHVIAAVNASAAKLCRPLPQRRRPATLQDAKYSVPFMIAFTLVHGRVDLETLGAHALRDPAVLELAGKIDVEERLPDAPGHPPAEITVTTVQGRAVTCAFRQLHVTAADARAKFLACLARAGRGDRAAALWTALQRPYGSLEALLGTHGCA